METDVSKKSGLKAELWEWGKALLIAAILVTIIRAFIFNPFVVDGESMQPNFYTGERVIVTKIIYMFRHPKRGEVIVFHATPTKDFIKRVIALPGETVKVVGDKVYINGKVIEEPYIKQAEQQAEQQGRTYNDRNYPEEKVPPGKIFVMGDNRSNSEDSRFSVVGFVPYNKIVGRADLIFWPFHRIGLVRR